MKSDYYRCLRIRQRIDEYLEEMAQLNAQYGTDTDDIEKESINAHILELEYKIKVLDEDFYNSIKSE